MTETYVRRGKVKWIVKGSDVGVQERTLAPGDEIPWHYHTVITDTAYCIEGVVRIDMLDPPEHVLLAPGESHAVAPHRPHQIMAEGEHPCRFLLIQGVGDYDRHPLDPTTWHGTKKETQQ
jgi:quercetin dioxygenase-like cupin family protein